MSEIWFTTHAVERFVQRHAPEMNMRDAKNLLESKASSAVRLRQKTIRGQDQWQIQDPDCVLVTKNDRNRDNVREVICVTILPEPENRGISEEDLEYVRELAEESKSFQELVKRTEAAEKEVETAKDVRQRRHLHLALIASEERIQRAWALLVRDTLVARNPDLWVRRGQHENVVVQKERAIFALRTVLRYMTHNDGSRDEVLRQVRKIDPHYLSDSFLLSKKETQSDTVQEREEDD